MYPQWLRHVEFLRQSMTGERMAHSLAVARECRELAELYGENPGNAALAGLYHDFARDLTHHQLIQEACRLGLEVSLFERLQPVVLHGPVGAALLRERGVITDEIVLSAMARHTLGAASMSTLDAIVYLADMIEPQRQYEGVGELRVLSRQNLWSALLAGYDQTLFYLLSRGELIHPRSIEARNDLILRRLEGVLEGSQNRGE